MAKRLPAILFDLDGTLLDSIDLILQSARHAFLGRQGPVPTDAEWLSRVGTPLSAAFKRYAKDDADVDALIAKYREFQLPNHDRLVRAYDGVVDTVRTLHEARHPMAIVTSKTETLARRGLDIVGLGSFFELIVGCDTCEFHKPDPRPVLLALERLRIAPGLAVFVGDSVFDMEAGNAAGVTTVAALWGPFSRAELEVTEPGHYLDRVVDLPALLKGLSAGGNKGSA